MDKSDSAVEKHSRKWLCFGMKKIEASTLFSRKIGKLGQAIFCWIEKEKDHNHVLSNHWRLMFFPSWQLESASISLAQFFVVP